MAKITGKKEPNKKVVASNPAAEEGQVKVAADKEKYTATKAASGSKSLHNNDPVALALEGLTLEEVQTAADKTIGDNDFRTRYANLNAGMQRMNIGNRIRGWMNKDEGNPAKLTKAVGPLQKAAAARVKAAAAAKVAAKSEKAA